METTRLEGSGLSIPTCYVTPDGDRKWLEPQVVRHTLLEQLFSTDELKSLLLVKLDRESLDAKHLKASRFEDGITRKLVFSSDKNFYFADQALAEKLTQFFATERDAACRYGSLLVSDCYKGITSLNHLNLKLVDYSNPNYADFKTHDCHGKISPRLLKSLGFEGASPDCPFQFRMAYDASRSDQPAAPTISFLAKGTLLVDPTLPRDIDLVMDRTSIKGVRKDQLDDCLPCGNYQLASVAFGNRANAEVSRYSNSWQFSMWYSKDAILADFLKPTLKQAHELADRQRNPLRLAQYLVNQHDKQQQFRQQNDVEDGTEDGERQESRMISILRHDTPSESLRERHGLLLYAPKIVDFMESQVANRWRELVVNTGFQHSSGMAQPGLELPRGTICAPHLPKGDVIVTRYPIVSSDNIRVYRNTHDPKLCEVKGAVWINPRDAAEYHQCDFDGDQLIATPTKWMPNIAKETLRAGEARRFPPVVKRQKVPYTEVQNESGNFTYNTLPKVAAAVCQNSIGRVATLIGRVHTSEPTPDEAASPTGQRQFAHKQQKLLHRLMAALQVEVDSPKSADRLESIDPSLLDDTKQWRKEHPSPFFDFQKDPRLYRQFGLPTQAPEQSQVSVLCAIAEQINPLWEATQLRSLPREHFRYLFEREDLDVDALDWAETLKERAKQATAQIREMTGEDGEAFREALGNLYESYRAEIHAAFPSDEEKRQIAAAIWHTQHTRPELDRPRKQSIEVAKTLPVTFNQDTFMLPSNPYEVEAYELSVPFDRAQDWMNTLEARHIRYEAVVNAALPVVDFYLPDLSERNAATLQQTFGNQIIDVDQIPDDLRVVPPVDLTWAQWEGDTGKAALAYTLMTEQVIDQLQEFEIEAIKAIGIAHNDYATENFSRWRNQIQLEVVPYELDPNHPKYHAMNGVPVLKVVNGGVLGTFAPETPKLPIGATFEAAIADFTRSMVQLQIDPRSVQVERQSEETPQSLSPLTGRQSLQVVGSAEPRDLDGERSTQALLAQAIAQTYHRLPSPTETVQLPIGSRWQATVMADGDYAVWDEQGGLVCQGNFETGEVGEPMNSARAEEFQRMVQGHKADNISEMQSPRRRELQK